MSAFHPYSGFDPLDGLEPHVELSRDNPLWVPELPDAGREGVDFEHVYQPGGGHSDSDRFAPVNFSLHANPSSGETQRDPA